MPLAPLNLNVCRKYNYLVRNTIRGTQLCSLYARVIWTENAGIHTDHHAQVIDIQLLDNGDKT